MMKFGPKKFSPMGMFDWLSGAQAASEEIKIKKIPEEVLTQVPTVFELISNNTSNTLTRVNDVVETTVQTVLEETPEETQTVVNDAVNATLTTVFEKTQTDMNDVVNAIVTPVLEETPKETLKEVVNEVAQVTKDRPCEYTDTLCQLNNYIKTNTGYSFGLTLPGAVKNALHWVNEATYGIITPVTASILFPGIITIGFSAFMIRSRQVAVKDKISPELYECVKNNNAAILLFHGMDKSVLKTLTKLNNPTILALVKKLEATMGIKTFLKMKTTQQELYISGFESQGKRQEMIESLIQQLEEKKRAIQAKEQEKLSSTSPASQSVLKI